MTIRNRLLVLLLSIALAPLILTSLVHQISIRVARGRLTANTRQALDTNARMALPIQLGYLVDILEGDRRLILALLKRQVREVELALAASEVPEDPDFTDNRFGFDANLTNSPQLHHPYFTDTDDGETAALDIDYRSQGYSIAQPANRTAAMEAMKRLSTITPLYHEIYSQMPSGVLWLHTRFDNGLHVRYPAGGKPPEALMRGVRFSAGRSGPRLQGQMKLGWPPDARGQGPMGSGQRGVPRSPNQDGRQRFGNAPLRQAGQTALREETRIADQVRGSNLMVDPSTDQTVAVTSMPVHNPDGSPAGVVVVMRTIPEIFENMQLAERWGSNVDRMLIFTDPNALPEDGITILLHDNLDTVSVRRGRRVIPGVLQSSDSELFARMIDDLLSGRPGVQRMDYQGRSCLWAYQSVAIEQAAALLIIPYERVTKLAQDLEQSLIKESIFGLESAMAVLLVVAALAVILAAMRARNLTNPITALIEAGRKLAAGDYDAKVHINTGDELEQLGHTFNETGPKLRERQKLKHSLELAGAVQQWFLPDRMPELANFQVAGRCLYCDETGGDCYDFIEMSDPASGKLGIVVGDVSGHGIGSALLMAALRSMLRMEAQHQADNLASILNKLNAELVRDTDDDKFVTLFYGLLDDNNRSMIFSSAGHEPAIHLHADTGRIEKLSNNGPPLGIIKDQTYNQAGPVILEPGDILVVGTDGIWETQNQQGQFFGKERFLDILQNADDLSAEQICSNVIDSVTHFVHPASRTDDITLIVVKAL